MNSFLDQLKLTTAEKRALVAIAVIVFVVLNILLVWPHFKDLRRVRADLEDTRKKMKDWNAAILHDVDASTNGYKNVLKVLQQQQGGGIGNEQIQLQKTISDQAIQTGVNISDTRPMSAYKPDTNEFYEEQSVRITFESEEPKLVNFLYRIGNDPAMIRVREINLHVADANRYRLKGDAFLSASYAKKPKSASSTKAASATAKGAVPKTGPPKTGPGKAAQPAFPLPGPRKPIPAPNQNRRPPPGGQS